MSLQLAIGVTTSQEIASKGQLKIKVNLKVISKEKEEIQISVIIINQKAKNNRLNISLFKNKAITPFNKHRKKWKTQKEYCFNKENNLLLKDKLMKFTFKHLLKLEN